MNEPRFGLAACSWRSTSSFALLPIYWMVNMSLQDERGDPLGVLAVAAAA
jgi:hypothetical protein